jgi:formylglycine-generating enzyme required for sulfatase activity
MVNPETSERFQAVEHLDRAGEGLRRTSEQNQALGLIPFAIVFWSEIFMYPSEFFEQPGNDSRVWYNVISNMADFPFPVPILYLRSLAARMILASGALALVVPTVRAAEPVTNSVGMTLVEIPAGHFLMGQEQRQTTYLAPWSAEKDRGADWFEQPVHKVEISRPFLMSATEVTNAQYEQFDPAHRSRRPTKNLSAEDDAAVVNVSWDDAGKYCQWLSQKEGKPYRLPTEAEWEYACRAGTTTLFSMGDTLPDRYHQVVPALYLAWDYYFPKGTAVPSYYNVTKTASLRVGQHGTNAWGLSDMHGNVAEWCQDWFAPYAAGAVRDPMGPATGDFRIVRGGSHSVPARLLRSASRAGMEPWVRNTSIGFRVVQAPALAAPAIEAVASPTPLPRAEGTPAPYDPSKPFFTGPQRHVNVPAGMQGPLFAKHNHDPALAQCANGDLLAIWYTTDEETGTELAVAGTRLPAGAGEWTAPFLFWDCPNVNNHAPALFEDKDGTLFHFNGSKAMPGSVVRYSKDNGRTWSAPVPCDISTQPNEATIRTRDGRILATFDGAPYLGDIAESRDDGKTWKRITEDVRSKDFGPGSTGRAIAGIHVGLVELADGTLWALGRFDKEADHKLFHDHLPLSISRDGGRTWTYQISPFPSISWGQRFTLKRMKEGPLILCSYTDNMVKPDKTGKGILGKKTQELVGMTCTDSAGKTFTGYGLFAALSFDDGKTWPVRRLLTPGGPDQIFAGTDGGKFALGARRAEPNGYLASCVGKDGRIHLISSRNYYSFNLAWLTQGTSYADFVKK